MDADVDARVSAAALAAQRVQRARRSMGRALLAYMVDPPDLRDGPVIGLLMSSCAPLGPAPPRSRAAPCVWARRGTEIKRLAAESVAFNAALDGVPVFGVRAAGAFDGTW